MEIMYGKPAIRTRKKINDEKGENNMSCSIMVLKNVTEDEHGAALVGPEDYETFRTRLQTTGVRVALAENMRNGLEYDLMENYKGSIENPFAAFS